MRKLLTSLVLAVSFFLPVPLLAQRGHVGGAFHGGAGRYAYGGAHLYGDPHFAGGLGWHSPYAWHGGYWGYPHYGHGWGLSVSIGFGWPYWLSYAYPYPYWPGWGVPCCYPYYYYYPLLSPPAPYSYPYADDRKSATPQNAIQHLREMPPYAREREINRGRYSHFTTEEKGRLRSLAHQSRS